MFKYLYKNGANRRVLLVGSEDVRVRSRDSSLREFDRDRLARVTTTADDCAMMMRFRIDRGLMSAGVVRRRGRDVMMIAVTAEINRMRGGGMLSVMIDQ